MRLIGLAVALAVSLSLAFQGSEAQQAGKVYRIGILHLTPDLSRMEALRNGLTELGYIEGLNIAIMDRLAE